MLIDWGQGGSSSGDSSCASHHEPTDAQQCRVR